MGKCVCVEDEDDVRLGKFPKHHYWLLYCFFPFLGSFFTYKFASRMKTRLDLDG